MFFLDYLNMTESKRFECYKISLYKLLIINTFVALLLIPFFLKYWNCCKAEDEGSKRMLKFIIYRLKI
jgi:hypothetical protein